MLCVLLLYVNLRCSGGRKVRRRRSETPVKLEFHGTDTDSDTDVLADFRARILARKSACPATSPFSLPRAEHAQRSSPTCPPTCPTRALFLTSMSVRDASVYTFTKLHYRRFPKVRVGVGPMEFQLNSTDAACRSLSASPTPAPSPRTSQYNVSQSSRSILENCPIDRVSN